MRATYADTLPLPFLDVAEVLPGNMSGHTPDGGPHATGGTFRNPAYTENKQAPIHRWVNWIAGFSADFAGDVIDRYIPAGSSRARALVVEPFAGVGTTLIEAQRRGIASLGFEINPFPALAARAKLEAALLDVDTLRVDIARYERELAEIEARLDMGKEVQRPRRTPPAKFRSRMPFFPAKVLPKVLHSLDYIDGIEDRAISDLFRLAFATTMVSYSNYTYEPSLSSRPGAGKPLLVDAPVSRIIAAKLRDMAQDVALYSQELRALPAVPPFQVHLESVFDGASRLADASVDLVVTSPPYLNNFHYVRNTRPHLYWLGYVSTPRDQCRFETNSFGKFWQTVREAPEIPVAFDLPHLAAQIAELRVTNTHKGIYGGAGWANYAATYYNDSYRIVAELARLLKPDGVAVFVVGNNVLQGIEFRVDDDLVAIARLLGLEAQAEIVRKTRVGSSIMGTGAREKVERRIELYEAAVTMRRPAKRS